MKYKKKPHPIRVRFSAFLSSRKAYEIKKKMSVCLFQRFDTSRANVTVGFFTVCYVRNFLNVYLERSSRFTVGVAYVVTARLTLTANAAYSGHINTSEF